MRASKIATPAPQLYQTEGGQFMPPSTFMYGFKPITKEPEVLTTPKPQKQYGGGGQRPSPKKVPQKSKYNSNSYRLIIAFSYSSLIGLEEGILFK